MAIVAAVASVWLFTLDVYVAERGTDGAPAFCGSAYDVALIKRDGYMGGEVPANEAAIDRACVGEATTDMVLAGLAASLALAGLVYALRLYERRSKQEGRRRPAWG